MHYPDISITKKTEGLLRQKVLKYDAPEKVRSSGLYPYFRVMESDQDTKVTIDGKPVLMFGSNSYLGLTNRPAIKSAAKQAITKYGTGCEGSRFLNGTLDIPLEPEEQLAAFIGKEAALVFSTGFQVNIGVILALVGRNDYLILNDLRNGYEVYAGLRPGSSKAYLQNDAIHFFRIDLSSPELMERQFNSFNRPNGGFDHITHNAGITRAGKKEDLQSVNCLYTKNLASALVAACRLPEKFVYISSMPVYGPGNPLSLEPIRLSDEEHPISAYAKSKLAAEHYIKLIHVLNPVIIRPTAVYGPRDKDFLSYFRMLAKGMEFYIGSGKQLLSFIYVKDLAMAVFKILSLPAPDASYIVSDGRTYGKDEMGSIIKKIINKRTLKINLRRAPILSTEFCIEKIYALFGSMHFLHTEKIKEITASNWSCDSARLWEKLRTGPSYSMQEAIAETANWYRENGWLH